MATKEELQKVADEQTRKDLGPAAVPVEKAKETTVKLECVNCHNVESLEEVLNRTYYPGSCGHCGGSFRVVKA